MGYLKLSELRKMAIGSGIKFYYNLPKDELTKALNLDEKIVCKTPNAKPVLIEYEDGLSLWCKSQYECGKFLGKETSFISYHVKTKKPLKHNGETVKISFAKD